MFHKSVLAFSTLLLLGCNRNPTVSFQNLAPKFFRSYVEIETQQTQDTAKELKKTVEVEFEPGFDIDVRKTDSTISPYIATLDLIEKRHWKDNQGNETDTLSKTIHFVYQNNKWGYSCSDFRTSTSRDYYVEDTHLDNLRLNGLPDTTCYKALAMVR